MTALAPLAGPLPDRPHLLLIGSGDRRFREYLLSPLAVRYRVHLFTTTAVSWEAGYLDGCTVLGSRRRRPADCRGPRTGRP